MADKADRVGADEPGSIHELLAAMSAKVLGSAVFISGREVEEALANSVCVLMRISREDFTDVVVDPETRARDSWLCEATHHSIQIPDPVVMGSKRASALFARWFAEAPQR